MSQFRKSHLREWKSRHLRESQLEVDKITGYPLILYKESDEMIIS